VVTETEDNVCKRINHRATPPQKTFTILQQPCSTDDTARNLFPTFAAKGPSGGYISPLRTEQNQIPLESNNMPYSKEVGISSKSRSGNESTNPSQAPLEENEQPSDHMSNTNAINDSNSSHAGYTAALNDSDIQLIPAILIANPLIEPAIQAIPPSNDFLRDAWRNFFARIHVPILLSQIVLNPFNCP
jgi:hypothetical protein